jgi:hypothetical protein
MSESLDVVSGFSSWVKFGWVVWLLWCLVQIEWYRQRARKSTALPRTRQRTPHEFSRDPWRSPARPAAAHVTPTHDDVPASDFLRELGLDR